MSRGGQHMGSVWGHGAYLAPDWSADYLHRMGLFLAARHLGRSAEEAAAFTQADLQKLDLEREAASPACHPATSRPTPSTPKRIV